MSRILAILLLVPLAAAPCFGQAAAENKRPSFKEATAGPFPPAWLDSVQIQWDMTKPWKDGRLEVRRLLGIGDDSARQAVKITWLYAQKGDIGNGHELPMYLFMSGNYGWAAVEYPKHIKTVADIGPTHEYLCYASCLAHFGEYDKAIEVLGEAGKNLAKPPWRANAQGNIQDALGDIYGQIGQTDKAKAAYAEAMRFYGASDQPYGRHLIPRNIAKVQNKLDLLTRQSLDISKLRDGAFTGRSLGYADQQDMQVTVTIKAGKITDVQVKHQEKIELGATKSVPQAIIQKQSLKVDAVTGATVTSQAIIDGALQAMKQAGLK